MYKVLILEDNEFLTDTFRDQGETEGISVCVIGKTEAFKEFVQSKEWDAISLDHDLGNQENGLEVLRWMLQNKESAIKGKPVIFTHSSNPVGVFNMKREYGEIIVINKLVDNVIQRIKHELDQKR